MPTNVVGVVFVLLGAGLLGHAQRASDRPVQWSLIDRVDKEDNGCVRIGYGDGIEVRPAIAKDQVGCTKVVVASDKQTVGWLAEYPNCCTSYPIPLILVLYRHGEVIHTVRDGQMMYDWHWWAGGTQVVYHADTVHGNFSPHSVLVDVDTGRVLARWDAKLDAKAPAWARTPR